MSRTRVLVLRGGPSDEYEVSLRTGSAVLHALDTTEFEPLDVVITKNGEWLHDGRTRYPEHVLPTVDVVFNALHGAYGEDGTLQRTLDRFGVPYTGSGAYASGISMHKAYTKEHIKGLGVHLPQHVIVSKAEYVRGSSYAREIKERFGPQYILKPLNSGSSVGIVHVEDGRALGDAIDAAFEQYADVLVEEYIEGREFTCGVIERYRNHDLYALPPTEIIPPPGTTFFSEAVKYDGSTKEVCPASLSRSLTTRIEDAAKAIHQTLGLRQYSRSDFILKDDRLYFLEINTLPGLTDESLFPKALHAVGSNHKEFVRHLVYDALEHC